MQLETFLLERGVVTPRQVSSAIDRQRESRPPLGRLAIEQETLSARDVSAILHWQQATSPRRFGEIAVELGYLSEGEIERLLALQAQQTLSLTEALLDVGIANEDACRAAAAEFERMLAGTRVERSDVNA